MVTKKHLREQRREATAAVTKRRENPPPKPKAAMLHTWEYVDQNFSFSWLVWPGGSHSSTGGQEKTLLIVTLRMTRLMIVVLMTCPTLQDLFTIGSASLELSLFSKGPCCQFICWSAYASYYSHGIGGDKDTSLMIFHLVWASNGLEQLHLLLRISLRNCLRALHWFRGEFQWQSYVEGSGPSHRPPSPLLRHLPSSSPPPLRPRLSHLPSPVTPQKARSSLHLRICKMYVFSQIRAHWWVIILVQLWRAQTTPGPWWHT